MTKKIFYAIFSVCSIVFLLSGVLTFTALYNYFSGIEESRLEDNLKLVEQGMEDQGQEYLEGTRDSEFRLTLIEPDGTVIFDSQADPADLSSHADREEIREALSDGVGRSSRYSDTLTERAFYYARKQPDGNVLRISASSYSVLALFMGIFPALILIFLGALALSLLLATQLSKKIVAPLNELDLDHPSREHVYEELDPLMLRLSLQQKQIREQKEELADRAREFRVISNAVSEGLVLLSSELRILSINPAARTILQITEEDQDELFTSLCPSEKISEMVKKSVSGKRQSSIVDWNSESWMVEISPVMHDEHFQGCVLLIMNFTDQKKAEQMRREFTGNVSHELKSPLQTISGYSELMSSGMVSERDIPEFSARILSESRRMTSLINEILTLSYLDEAVSNELEEIDLKTFGQSIMNELSYPARKEGIHLHFESAPLKIMANPAMIRSILYNLTDNAIKYNREDGDVWVKIEKKNHVFDDSEQPAAKITIRDNGLGICPEDQERIFERFYRVDKSRSRQKGGTGLGLSIVKHALRLHNGQIALDSIPEQGTVFTVWLPLEQPQASEGK